MDEPTNRDYKVMCELLMYHMSMETRRIVMRELPGSYNRINGKQIVTVVRSDDMTRL